MRLSVHPYRLPLTAPLALPAGAGQAAGTLHASRRGALLRLEDGRGLVGWGDAAPLPGFSQESAEDAADQLGGLASWAARRGAARWTDPALDHLALLPSVRFALDLALLDLHAQRARCTMAQALSSSPSSHLSVNALLPSPDDAQAEAARLFESGYETLKVKVGRRAVDEDVALLRALHDRFPAVALRADANRAWSYEEARRFAGGVRDLGLEYVEEPLADASRLERLWAETALPLALDESLVEMRGGEAAAALPPWAVAVVLKPTFLGGLARSMQLAGAARAVGAQVVVSSAFESGIGVRGLVALAAGTGAAPSGLDPYRRLAADVLSPSLPLDHPVVDVADVLGARYSVLLPADAA